jgi:hypothetical protein
VLERSLAELDARIDSPAFDVEPYAVLQRLRELDPVHWSDSIDGWLVTRFDDVLTTFRNFDEFSNEGRFARSMAYLSAAERGAFPHFEEHYTSVGLLHSDPPDHTRLRALLLGAFKPRVIEAMRDRIQALVDSFLDRASANGGMEVISELAWELPSTVLADLLGAPPEARPLFKGWADGILSFQGVNRPTVAALTTVEVALAESRAYLLGLIEQRRAQPTDDLLSHLVASEADGDTLSQAELLSTCVTLMVAGQETTTALIGNGLYLLLAHPEAWQALAADRSLVRSAVEEVLRFESPIPRQPRLMRKDAELGGKRLRAGDVVYQMINAANRDPEHFADPDTFDIRRSPNRHIAFGQGRHACLGAPLSRMEGQIVFESILERFPRLRLREQTPRWDPLKRTSRILRQLHVSF